MLGFSSMASARAATGLLLIATDPGIVPGRCSRPPLAASSSSLTQGTGSPVPCALCVGEQGSGWLTCHLWTRTSIRGTAQVGSRRVSERRLNINEKCVHHATEPGSRTRSTASSTALSGHSWRQSSALPESRACRSLKPWGSSLSSPRPLTRTRGAASGARRSIEAGPCSCSRCSSSELEVWSTPSKWASCTASLQSQPT